MKSPKKSAGLWVGAIFITIGLVPMVLMFFKPQGLKVSFLMAQMGASAFIFAGLSFIAQAQGRPGLARMFSFSVLLILAFIGLAYLQ